MINVVELIGSASDIGFYVIKVYTIFKRRFYIIKKYYNNRRNKIMKNFEMINLINHFCREQEEWDDYINTDIYTPYEIFYETLNL